ncbi:MAG: type IV pilus assembly protein PilM [Candidatus Aquicultor sp.]
MGLLGLGRGSSPVGLDIGGGTFRLAQLKPSADKPVLINYATIKTPEGLVSEGEILDVEGVAKTLASFWREKKISEKEVVVGVANQKVIVRVVEMPYMVESELRSAIQYQINEYIPIPVEEAIIDIQIISEHENSQQERMMDVLVVAARKEMVENTVAALEKAGLKPVVVDVSSLAFARALADNTPEKVLQEEDEHKAAIAMINISSNLTDIVVIEDEIPRFTRVSSIGGRSFTDALVEQLGMTFDEAEDLKKRIGLPASTNNEPVSDDSDISDVIQYKEAVQNVLEQEMIRFVAEIRRSLDYYLVQATRAKSIEKIVISGGGAKLKNFIQYLQDNFQIEVELGQPLHSVQLSKRLKIENIQDEELSMAICLGLAMRGVA